MKTIISFLLLLHCFNLQIHTQEDRNGWQLIWEDNFDFLNEEIWLVKNNFDHWGGEEQVYTNRPENVFIDNGNLVLRVRREEYSCPPEFISQWHCVRQYNTGEPYQYTSGWIETQQPDYNTQYGLIEARIMLPYGYGFWPAFWTFKADNPPGGTNAAEIDIFEMLGSKPPNKITTNIHLEYCNESQPDYPVCANIPSYYQENVISNYAYSYHTFAIDWSPSHLRWWIDDYMFRIDPNPGVVDPVRTILNMALEPWAPPNASTPFPSDMLIDFVRVYSLVTGSSEYSIPKTDLTLHPNPASGNNTTRLQAWNGLQILSLEVINSIGQIVYMRSNIIEGSHVDLELPHLLSGIYFIHAKTNKGPAQRSLIIQ